MERVPISDKQKEQLMEICSFLYPEMDNIRFDQTWDTDFVIFRHKGKVALEIHWFELCLTDIARELQLMLLRISDLEPEEIREEAMAEFEDGADILKTFIYKQIHPIDQLYEEFKKLKP